MRKSLVVFYSKHGFTENVAKRVAKAIDADLMNLSVKRDVDLSKYEKVIIGSAIYAGNVNGKVKVFVKNYLDELLKKKVGLFICCGEEKQAEEQFNRNFPEELRAHAFVKGLLGGEIIMKKLGFFERRIVQMINKSKDDISNRKDDVVEKFLVAVKK